MTKFYCGRGVHVAQSRVKALVEKLQRLLEIDGLEILYHNLSRRLLSMTRMCYFGSHSMLN